MHREVRRIESVDEGSGDEEAQSNARLAEAPLRGEGETVGKRFKETGFAELMRNANLQNQKHSLYQ